MIKSTTTIDSLYLHFPFCRHLCNYCDFYKYKTDGEYTLDHYHEYLRKSLPLHQIILDQHEAKLGTLKTFYIGGGTPSLWGEKGVAFLTRELSPSFNKNQYEATLEVNPGSWSKEGLEAWKEFGMNRFSLGIQSLDDFYLKILDRVHNVSEVHQTLAYFHDHFKNFSVDFILGLPKKGSGNRDILRELKEILAYKPTHLSLYILTVGSNYPHFSSLPSEEEIEAEYLAVADFLKSLGFIHYEVSNFALPGFESAHNLAYWKSNSVAALGPSATGLIRKSEGAFRYKWKGKEAEIIPEELSAKELRLESIYMRLRTFLGIDSSWLSESSREQLVSKWQKAGYLSSFEDQIIRVNSRAFLVLDSLMNDLFLFDKSL